MRRILLAAFALLLLHAAPAMATECRNLALDRNGGTAFASSNWVAHRYEFVNNGTRDHSNMLHWMDNTPGVYPDWAGIQWRTLRTIDRIVIRGVVFRPGWPTGANVLGRVRVQWWDQNLAVWTDVVGRTGQDNPIVNWTMPIDVYDGSEIKQFDIAPIATTRVRVLIEDGSADDDRSRLDEIEAYDTVDCIDPADRCVNLAPRGTPTASSVHSSGLYPVSGVTNGQVESGATKGYWNDDTNATWPDWVQIAWAQPVTLSRIDARIPLAQRGFPLGEITMRRTRIQYWDATTSAWVDVTGAAGQANPILDWTGPIEVADGSETRRFDFAPITTTKVRALIEAGSSDGWSWLDELEAYSAGCATPRAQNLALAENGATPSASSGYTNWNATSLNDGVFQTSSEFYWNDFTRNVWPDWAQIEWSAPTAINRIILRGPIWSTPGTSLARTRVQYWNGTSWTDVVGRTGQDNPILNWVMPTPPADGSQVKQFDFAPITTTKIRALVEQGSSDGWSFLSEIEAYEIS